MALTRSGENLGIQNPGSIPGYMRGGGYNPAYGAAGSAVGSWLGRMFGDYQNPADAASPYFDQIPDFIKKYLGPYAEAGNRMLPGMEDQFGQLMKNPGDVLNRIGAGYQQSPGFKFALNQALQGAGHAAAAGGMAGSPQNQQQEMELATNLANQDYNKWISNALGLYGRGLSGAEDIYGTGARAGMGMGEDLASYMANRAKLAYEGANAQNQREEGFWGAAGGAAGAALPFLFM